MVRGKVQEREFAKWRNIWMFEWMNEIKKGISLMNAPGKENHIDIYICISWPYSVIKHTAYHQWIYTENFKYDIYKIKCNSISCNFLFKVSSSGSPDPVSFYYIRRAPWMNGMKIDIFYSHSFIRPTPERKMTGTLL